MAYSTTPLSFIERDACSPPEPIIFGRSEHMRSVQDSIERVKGRNEPILIQGESGTGKEVIARFLHSHSPWAGGPMVKVSCPAIPSMLLESELFGYERGAFTGAYGAKPGRIEMAHRGTLFLDEIGDLDLSLQAKLLQLLQDGQFSRIGAQRDKRIAVRVVCATNCRLEKEVQAGSFRQDLYYRINVVSVELPPLRRRREDIPDLVEYFLEAHSSGFSSKTAAVSASLMNLLVAYDWPGNIRELENLIRRYVILGNEEAITRELLDPRHDAEDGPIQWDGSGSLRKLTRLAVLECERKAILKALHLNGWNRQKAAQSLEISYRSLLYKMHAAGLPGRNGDDHVEGSFPSQMRAASSSRREGSADLARRRNGHKSSDE